MKERLNKRSEFDKALKDLNPQKAVGVDEISDALLSSLGQEGINRLLIFTLIRGIHKTSEILSHFKKKHNFYSFKDTS